jgi:Domain of unknown function (DUF397).
MIFQEWKKSSKSGGNNGECVEIRRHDDAIQIRDSKDPSGAVLTFTTVEWRTFIAGAKAGEFD